MLALSARRLNRFRGALVAREVALSVVLLSGARILLHSFWNALRVNPSFDPNRLLVARIWIPSSNNPKGEPAAATLLRLAPPKMRLPLPICYRSIGSWRRP